MFLLVLYLVLNDSMYLYTFDMIPWFIYITTVSILMEKSSKSFSTLSDKYFRIKKYPLCIFIIVWSSIALLSNIGTCARILALTQTDKSNAVKFAMSILYCIATITTLCIVLNFARQWIKTLRWEYDELELSPSEKATLIEKEKAEYKALKEEIKEDYKKRTLAVRQEKKQSIQNSVNNIKQKFSEINVFNKKENTTTTNKPKDLTKYDKLQELNELYENGIICKEELEKARADILGQ